MNNDRGRRLPKPPLDLEVSYDAYQSVKMFFTWNDLQDIFETRLQADVEAARSRHARSTGGGGCGPRYPFAYPRTTTSASAGCLPCGIADIVRDSTPTPAPTRQSRTFERAPRPPTLLEDIFSAPRPLMGIPKLAIKRQMERDKRRPPTVYTFF